MKLQPRDPKFIFGLFIGIIGTWLIAQSGTDLLDKYFELGNWVKLGLGLGLAYFGLIKKK